MVAIYSTFAQRAFDQLLHDVAIQELPFTLCLDRAGIVGDDGATHHGNFDCSYLRLMPHFVIMAPKDENELRHMLYTATEYEGPCAIRYPRGSGVGVPVTESLHTLPIGRSERLQEGSQIDLWAVGTMVEAAKLTAKRLRAKGLSVGVVNGRFIKPLDQEALLEASRKVKLIVTLEENALCGGYGEGIISYLNQENR